MNDVYIYQYTGVLWAILLLVRLLAHRLWYKWKFKLMPNCVLKDHKKEKKNLFLSSIGCVRPLVVSHIH